VRFAEGDTDYHAFPLEEDYDVDPMDSYGLSKVTNEKTARAFAARYKADIYALRIGNVIEPHDYARFPGFVANPPLPKAQCLELHRRARPRPDRAPLPADRWARLPGLQRRQRYDHCRRPDRRVFEKVVSQHAAPATARGR